MKKIIKQRTPFFLPVEGEGEQSFIKWIQYLCDQNGLHVHLDCQLLGGGGYKTMLEKAVRYRRHKERHKAKYSILVLDGDRADYDDGWSLLHLRQEAEKCKMIVCVQQPNLEGLLLRLLPGRENLQPSASSVQKQLRSAWPDYEKPADARALITKFKLEDLLRVARIDLELRSLLTAIGLYR